MKKLVISILLAGLIISPFTAANEITDVLEGHEVEVYLNGAGKISLFVKGFCQSCSDKFYEITESSQIFHQLETLSVPLESIANKKYRADVNLTYGNKIHSVNILDEAL